MGHYTLLLVTLLSIIINNASAARLKRHDNDVIEQAIQEMMDDFRYHTFRPSYDYCPITAVVQREFPADASHAQAVNLTVGMVAIIHYTHIERARNRRRPNIPRAVYNFLALADRATNDEAGHLLAHSLGGPTDARSTYNFLPQSRCLNREVTQGYNYVNVRPNWYGVEETIRDHLTANRMHSAHWHLQVMYGDQNSRRPTSFRVVVRFFDENGSHLSQFDEGPYEIVNPPHEACSDQNHPWWGNLHQSTTTARSVPEYTYIVPELTPSGEFINYFTLGLWPGQ